MRSDELKNWLAILGLGGWLAVAAPESGLAEPATAPPEPGSRPGAPAHAAAPLYVVINHEEQYSVWPAQQEPPRGWRVMHDRIDLAGAVKRFPRIGDQRFRVVINDKEQYSIWPRDRRLPKGFRPVPELEAREPCRIAECGRLLAELEERGGGR